MKFTKIPESTFQHLAINAGVLLKDFTVASGTYTDANILGATTGGTTFAVNVDYVDFGDGIDNCPANMMELKRIKAQTATISGSFVSVDAALCKTLVAAADNTSGHIVPRDTLKDSDFADIWLVCDYSEYNGETNGGYVAIHLMNALNTAGFQLKTVDDGKAEFAFTFTAHYTMDDQTTVPYEIYVKAGTAET